MIDVHSHVVPRELPFGMSGDERWPRVEPGDEFDDVIVCNKLFRRVRRTAWDLDRRLEEISAYGVRTQVLSVMPELFSYWAQADQATEFCDATNRWLATSCANSDGAFLGFGIVPMQDPERAAAMVESVAQLGLLGIEVGSNINGVSIGDHRFLPVWREAERLGLCVFVHAFHPCRIDQFQPEVGPAVTFPLEIGEGVGALIASGVLSLVPRLRVLASHGGGSAALTLSRLAYVWESGGRVREWLPESPWDIARRLFYDCLVFDIDALQFLINRFGENQVVVGSDYPFIELPIGQLLVEGAEVLAPDVLEKISNANARRLLNLPIDHR